ncbi:MAG: TonB-dependent receptor [Bacteroidota bacterium]
MRLLLLLASLCTTAAAQPTVTGTVTDGSGVPIPSANVVVLNTPQGAATDAEGRFALDLAPGAVRLRVSAVGYATRIVPVDVPAFDLRITLQAEDAALDDIVVTAQRDEARLLDAPVAVTSILAREVEDARVWEAGDLNGRVPSYLYQESGVGFQAIQSIRGIQVFSENPAVVTYVDGVNGVDILAGGFALTDIERIEVLRGPQTTLFGRNALGGVVNIVTKRPTDAIAGFAEASAGNLGLQRYAAGVRGPIVRGELFGGASLLYQRRDGYFENDTTGTFLPLPDAAGAEVGEEQALYGNATLRWLPSDRFEAALNLKAQLESSDASAFFVGALSEEIALETPDALNLARIGSHERDILNGALSLTYTAPEVAVTSTSTVQRIGLQFEDIDSGGIFDSFADGERGGRNVQTVLSQELRATTAGRDAPVEATVGVFGFLQTAQEPTTNLTFRTGEDSFAIFRNEANNAGFAAFGQATVGLVDRLDFTLGLRYDYERREATFNGFGDSVLDGDVETVLRPDTTVSGTYSALSPKAALSYAVSYDVSVYASYTRGFRAGGVNAQRIAPSVDASVIFDPEYSDNVEVGAKGRLGDRLSASAAAFFISWTDLQFFNLVGPFTFARENVGDARSVGVEFEVSALPVDGLRLDAALSLLDTEYEDFVLVRTDPETFEDVETDVSGNRLANAPGRTLYGAAQYRLPVAPGVAVFARAEVRNVGGYFTDIQNDLRQDSYTILDGRLGVEAGRFEAAFWIENLGDERVLVYGSPDTSFNRRSLAGPPRTLGLTLRARY